MGSWAVMGYSFLETLHFDGQKWGYPPKEFKIFWLNIFLKSLYEKSKHSRHLFLSIQRITRLCVLRTPPPCVQRVNILLILVGFKQKSIAHIFICTFILGRHIINCLCFCIIHASLYWQNVEMSWEYVAAILHSCLNFRGDSLSRHSLVKCASNCKWTFFKAWNLKENA